ncbi:MAG TPA: endonuclease domain-containing protein [Patescibacteria group bacterium]|nr:endonuclease domain-containing protein [Patescibacteria group bacterium]
MDQKLDKITFARLLRYHQTEVEKLLWAKLRDKRLVGVKFRRQQTIGPYIVDFVSFERKLIIELDGGHHNTNMGKQRDSNRTQWLKSQGFEVVRFWNNDLVKNIEGVLEVIYRKLNTPHPFLLKAKRPLPQGERVARSNIV